MIDLSKKIVEINTNDFSNEECSIKYGYFSQFANKYGVYKIKNTITQLSYIGASSNIQARLVKHFSECRFNRHTNVRLQKDYNEHGFTSFEVSILEETTNLLEQEIKWQLVIGIEYLYNDKITGYYITDKLRKQRANSSKATHKSSEYSQKMSTLLSKYGVIMINSQGIVIDSFDTLNAISLKYPDFAINTIRGVCNGNKVSYKGYFWKYIDANGDVVKNKRD